MPKPKHESLEQLMRLSPAQLRRRLDQKAARVERMLRDHKRPDTPENRQLLAMWVEIRQLLPYAVEASAPAKADRPPGDVARLSKWFKPPTQPIAAPGDRRGTRQPRR